MNRFHRFAVTAVIGILTLTGCGGSDSGVFGRSKASGKVAVVLRDDAGAQGQELRKGIEEGAKEHDLDLIVTVTGSDPARERDAVSRAIANKVAALVVESVDSTNASADAEAAHAGSIPFFTIGEPAAAGTASHVEPDAEGAGRVAAEYLATLLGGKGMVAMVRNPGVHGARELEAGFRAGIGAHRGMSVVATVDAVDRATAQAAALALLRAHRPLTGFLASDPELALGATAAAYAGRRADVSVVAQGTSDELRAAIAKAAEGPVKATVVPRPRDMGRRMMEAIALHLGDEAVAAKIRVPVRLITRDSAAASQ